jgi:hypothetical protein
MSETNFIKLWSRPTRVGEESLPRLAVKWLPSLNDQLLMDFASSHFTCEFEGNGKSFGPEPPNWDPTVTNARCYFTDKRTKMLWAYMTPKTFLVELFPSEIRPQQHPFKILSGKEVGYFYSFSRVPNQHVKSIEEQYAEALALQDLIEVPVAQPATARGQDWITDLEEAAGWGILADQDQIRLNHVVAQQRLFDELTRLNEAAANLRAG